MTRASRRATHSPAHHPETCVTGRPTPGATAPARHAPTLLAPLLHALFFVAAATQSAIVPLLPRLSHTYGLSTSAGALLLAAPGLATLAVSMPAGALADRLGARRVTIAATALMAAAATAQAAPSYVLLMAGRLAFGLAFGIVWTSGVAWMSGSHSESGSPRLGAVATSAAVGMVAGPAIGGLLADQFGLSVPFLVVAALAGALTIALKWQPDATSREANHRRDTSLRALARLAPNQPGVVTGAAVLAISGAVSGVIQLLVPLELHHAGFSAGTTGVAFSGAAGVYIVVSAFVVKLGRRATTLAAAALAALALSLFLLPAALSTGAALLVAVLVASTAPRAVVSTVAYPLATDSAARGGLADGLVIGLLNGTWAAGLVLAPLLAGAVDQAAGPGPAYLVAVVPGVLGALWLLRRRPRREDAPATAETSESPTADHDLAPATA
ncbi:MAG: MFS transporter [Solirubrobacterales bacterium]|nr:MFS transporter [Solirubrobacterales bacterium]MBV9807417.1 MFS transporter [Solirubrobacterales bacterium]